MLAGSLTTSSIVNPHETDLEKESNHSCQQRNPLLWAVAWSNTAAEFGALCHQAFNLAKVKVIKQSKDMPHLDALLPS